jgi:hypothetical protein
MREHPEILELRERLRPLSRAETFGRIYNAGKTEVKHSLSRDTIMQLILQHLWCEGHKEAVRFLEKVRLLSIYLSLYLSICISLSLSLSTLSHTLSLPPCLSLPPYLSPHFPLSGHWHNARGAARGGRVALANPPSCRHQGSR